MSTKRKTKRTPWAETPAGVAYIKEQADYKSWVANGGPAKVDPDLCFVCQEAIPTHKATSKAGTFEVCGPCAAALAYENNRRNRVKRALGQGQGGQIFTMTLGADLLPHDLKVEVIQ